MGRLFADDVRTSRPMVDPVIDFSLLQKDLDSSSPWAKVWQPQISGEKSQILHTNFKHEAFSLLNGDVFLLLSIFVALAFLRHQARHGKNNVFILQGRHTSLLTIFCVL